jgi:ParB family transcriptional regulator, chromosome partitioning protein
VADRGMGRGLSAILSVSAPPEADGMPSTELRDLPVALVQPNKGQPRRQFDETSLQALADSVAERGVLQPVLVRPRAGGTFEIVAGERRWRAAKLAGLDHVPAIVQDRDDATTLEVALVENMAREDLNPVEEARAVAGLVEELGLTREEVGKRVGRSRVAISNLLRILDLPDDALALLADGTLTEGHGRALLLAEDHADRRRLARAAADGSWSVRVTEEQARAANARAAAPRADAKAIHPDQAAAASEIADALGGALGTEVKVRPRGTGYKVELAVDSLDEALALAQRVRAGA